MKKDGPDISTSSLLLFGFALLLSKAFWLLTDLSNYPPFSFLFSKCNFHYTKKEQQIALSLINQLRTIHRIKLDFLHVSSDADFVYVIIKTRQNQQVKVDKMITGIRKEMGEGNFYLNSIDAPYYQLNFVRDSLKKSMLLFS